MLKDRDSQCCTIYFRSVPITHTSNKLSSLTIVSIQTSITIMKRMPPVTKAELANIDGMGGQRVAISGEAILATIYAFLDVRLIFISALLSVQIINFTAFSRFQITRIVTH